MNNPTLHSPEATLNAVVHFFEHLKPEDLARIPELYTSDAQFKDPFNEVQGIQSIEYIFAHMFAALETPQFVITQQVLQGTQAFVTWNFLFAMPQIKNGAPQTIRGATHFTLREEGDIWRIAVHRDYWDAAEELYEKLPLIGGLMRWLKKRAIS
jgi:ketosteroid isomerase-like protein